MPAVKPITIPQWPGQRSGDRRTPDPVVPNETVRPIHEQVRQVASTSRRYAAVFGDPWISCDPDIVQKKNGFIYIRAILCLGELDEVVRVEIAGDKYSPGNPESESEYRGDWAASTTWEPPYALPYEAQLGEIYRFNGKYYAVTTPFTVTGTLAPQTPIGSAYRSNFGRVYANTNVNAYKGEPSQGIDPIMLEYFGTSYTDTLTGSWYGTPFALAYVTAKIPEDEFTDGFPTMRARVRGWRCYDPRNGLTVFTRNPALHLAAAIESPLIGYNRPVNWASVSAAAARCDDSFPDGPRIQCNLEIGGKPVPTQNWIETLRAYAGVILDFRQGEYHFVVDGPRATDAIVAFADPESDIELQALPDIDLVAGKDRKNVVRVKYTDTSSSPWRESPQPAERMTAAVTAQTELPNVQEFRMPGITVRAQAERFAQERLDEYQLEQWVCTLPVADEGANVRIGFVLDLSTPNGFDNDLGRVLGKSHTDVGQWLLRCRHYVPNAYQEPDE